MQVPDGDRFGTPVDAALRCRGFINWPAGDHGPNRVETDLFLNQAGWVWLGNMVDPKLFQILLSLRISGGKRTPFFQKAL